jgi:adenine-specific DNA glycosylase
MRRFSKREVREFYRRLAKTRPIPRTELEFINPFTLLVAVVLSAQATDIGVNKTTPALFAVADTPEKMLALGEERLIELIRTIGLFRTKAKNLIALSRILVEKYGSEVPRDRAALEALPGVGRTTATRSRRCPGSGARRRTSSSTSPSASRRSPSTRTSSGSPIVRVSRRARRRSRSRRA